MTEQITTEQLAEMIATNHKATKEAIAAAVDEARGQKEQIAVLSQKMAEGPKLGSHHQKSWGEQFAGSEAVKNFSAEHSRPGLIRIEMKTTLTSAGGSAGDLVTPMRDNLVPMPRRRLTIRNLLPTIRTTSNSVEYPKQTTRTNNAGMVAETTDKPESALAFTLVNTPVRTIAHWIPASRQVLDDAPQLKGIIDTELLYGLGLKEESQILLGDGIGQNLFGLVPQATAYAAPISVADVNIIDVIGLAALQLSQSDYIADSVVINSADWMRMRVLKNGDGDYILGDPTKDTAPVLWGLPVVATPSMTAGKFLVGSFQAAATLYDRWEPRVEASNTHSDYFTKNLVAILAEERLALAVKQSGALIFGDFDTALNQ